jgi:hypothetical protein
MTRNVAQGVDFIDWYARALEHQLAVRMLAEVVPLRRLHAANGGRRRRAHRVAGEPLAGCSTADAPTVDSHAR